MISYNFEERETVKMGRQKNMFQMREQEATEKTLMKQIICLIKFKAFAIRMLTALGKIDEHSENFAELENRKSLCYNVHFV